MKIDWASLGLVALTTLVVVVAIVGLYSAGVIALTSGSRQAEGQATSSGSKAIGYLCIGLCIAIMLYGFYLLVPWLHFS